MFKNAFSLLINITVPIKAVSQNQYKVMDRTNKQQHVFVIR
jgi:hypothetical protein